MSCHTIETMFANKLVAVLDRWEQHHSLAGRDIYDIHHFFMKGYRYDDAIILERRGTTVAQFLRELVEFIDAHMTQTVLQQDLNPLLDPRSFQRIKKTIRQKILTMLRDESRRVEASI